jgi:hypothetical protein
LGMFEKTLTLWSGRTDTQTDTQTLQTQDAPGSSITPGA